MAGAVPGRLAAVLTLPTGHTPAPAHADGAAALQAEAEGGQREGPGSQGWSPGGSDLGAQVPSLQPARSEHTRTGRSGSAGAGPTAAGGTVWPASRRLPRPASPGGRHTAQAARRGLGRSGAAEESAREAGSAARASLRRPHRQPAHGRGIGRAPMREGPARAQGPPEGGRRGDRREGGLRGAFPSASPRRPGRGRHRAARTHPPGSEGARRWPRGAVRTQSGPRGPGRARSGGGRRHPRGRACDRAWSPPPARDPGPGTRTGPVIVRPPAGGSGPLPARPGPRPRAPIPLRPPRVRPPR